MKKISEAQAKTIINKLRLQIGGYFKKHQLQTAIFGKSKGLDSSVVAGLLAKIPDIKPLGIIMPCESEQEDEQIAREVLEFYRIPYIKIDLAVAFKTLTGLFEKQNILSQIPSDIKVDISKNPYAKGNIKARLRMLTLYHIARLTRGAVIATGNYSEYMTGFWTLHGDVGDIYPLVNLYKTDIYMVGKVLNVPERSLKSVPTDGLGIAGTDEEQLGLPYHKLDYWIDYYLKSRKKGKFRSNADKNEYLLTVSRIKQNAFKRVLPLKLKV